MTAQTMSTMERILRLMAEKKASDVYLSANSPALIKINGEALPINNQVLPTDAPRNLLAEVLPPARIEELEELGERNMALPVAGVGNFRISAFRQRSTYAAVIRFVPTEIPPLESLKVPPILANLIMEKRGLLLMVGATGAGKSTTLAAMMDHRNATASGHILTIEDPVELVEVRNTLLGDLGAAMKAIVTQRLLRTQAGGRAPAVEVMLNTKLISELIEKGDFSGVKEAMEKSLAEGSQTFEQDIARLIVDGTVTRKEGLLHADSPTNLMWRLENDFAVAAKAAEPEDDADDEPSFTEITLDVKH
jgi:Tfp pilus assembly ATPase PilU